MGVKPTMTEELNEWLTKYRSPDIRFPQEGNEEEEHLADQIDQRMWSYMYGPGMQMLTEKIDGRVEAGMDFLEGFGKRNSEKMEKMEKLQVERAQKQGQNMEEQSQRIHELKLEQERGQGELEGKMKAMKVGLWGMGGLALIGMGGLGLVVFWPRIKNLLSKKDKKDDGKEASKERRKRGTKEDGAKEDYFRWRRKRQVKWE